MNCFTLFRKLKYSQSIGIHLFRYGFSPWVTERFARTAVAQVRWMQLQKLFVCRFSIALKAQITTLEQISGNFHMTISVDQILSYAVRYYVITRLSNLLQWFSLCLRLSRSRVRVEQIEAGVMSVRFIGILRTYYSSATPRVQKLQFIPRWDKVAYFLQFCSTPLLPAQWPASLVSNWVQRILRTLRLCLLISRRSCSQFLSESTSGVNFGLEMNSTKANFLDLTTDCPTADHQR